MRRVAGFAFLLLLIASSVAAEQIEVLYIANGMNRSGKGGSITAYRINRYDGSLTPVIGSPFDAGIIPYSLATDNGLHLYLANPALDDDNLRVYPIKADTGRLEFEHISTFDGANYEAEKNCCPGPMLADSGGKFAYIANTANKTVSVFDIFPGSLALTLSSTVNTRPGHFPVDLVWGPDQSTVYALTDTGLAVSLIHVYVRDPRNGALTEAADSPLHLPNVVQAASLSKRKLLLALTTSPKASGLSLYSVRDDGKLNLLSGSPFQFESSASAVAFAMHPKEEWIASVFSPRSTAPVVTIYRLGTDHRISPSTSLPLPCKPSCKITSLTFDASGKFLFLSDASQNQIIGLAFDSEKAVLRPISGSPWNAGDQPHSLLVVEPR